MFLVTERALMQKIGGYMTIHMNHWPQELQSCGLKTTEQSPRQASLWDVVQ